MTKTPHNSAAVAHRDRVLAALGLPPSIFTVPMLASLRPLAWHRMAATPLPLGNRLSVPEIADATGHPVSTVRDGIRRHQAALDEAAEVART